MSEQIFPSILTILEEFGAEVVRDIGQSIKDKDLVASGGLSKSVKFSIDVNLTDERYTFQLDMAPYWSAVDEGRKKGKQPPVQSIMKWLKYPNVKSKLGKENSDLSLKTFKDYELKGLAYVIARKIGREGTEPTYFFSSVVTQERLDKLIDDIGNAAVVDIVAQIN
jgi:hypothetical protein